MNRRQLTESAVIMILAFAVTLLALRRPTESLVPMRLSTLIPNSSWRAAALSAPSPRPARERAAAPIAPPAESTPPIEVPPADERGPPLPLLFTVSSHAAVPESDDDTPVRREMERQVDLLNNSDDPLNITVMAVNPPTQEQTLAQVLVPPHQRAQVGVDSGVKLAPGYQVTLRSRGFQQMTQVVN